MKIEVLGKGCSKCLALEQNVKKVLTETGIQAAIEHVTDMNKITDYGIVFTPALAVDGKVLASGKVLTTDEIRKLLGA